MRSLCLAAALAAAVFLAGCGGSNSSSSDEPSRAFEATEAAETTPRRQPGPTEAQLEPIGDSSAEGIARYQIRPGSTPVLHIEAEGLEPISEASRYAIWIVGNRHDMVNLADFQVGKDGHLARTLETPESYIFVEEGGKTELLLTRIDNLGQIREGISESIDPWDPPLIGDPVLSGTFEGSFVASAGSG
jgi:hypothetical protein